MMTKKDEFTNEIAVALATATFQNLALIGALAERDLIDPAKVADWAFFAKGMENSTGGSDSANLEHLRKVAARLRDYAKQLMNIVKIPDNPK
jgi:hypothetical protein